MTKTLQLNPPATPASVPPVRDLAPDLQTSAIYVLFTTIEDTLAAIRVASNFAKAMEIPLTVLHFRTVSYVVPVDSPAGISPVETAEFTHQLEREGLDVRVQVYLCREELAAVPLALSSPSLVVIGGLRGWWGSRSARWRRALEARGHLVIFAGNAESEVVSISRTQGVFRA
jgi:hypothetical protein